MTSPIEEVLARLKDVTRNGSGWKARCPAHEDNSPSLSVDTGDDGRVLLKCFAGCTTASVVSALGLAMRDLFTVHAKSAPTSKNTRNRATVSAKGSAKRTKTVAPDRCPKAGAQRGCSLEEYAALKKLPVDFLKGLGLKNQSYMGAPAIRVPYRGTDGSETATRFRTALRKDPDGSDNRFKWAKGSKTSLYGLWKLRRGTFIVLVEGESDCHALWQHGVNAVGVAGASNWKDERDAAHLASFETIYIVREPDSGGENLCKRLSASTLASRVKVVTFEGHKDVSDLHCADADHFFGGFNAALNKAVALTDVLALERKLARGAAYRGCEELANAKHILDELVPDLRALGLVGEERNAKILFLSLISRLFQRIVSVIVKGQSSTGKSFAAEQVLKFFPASAYYAMTAGSDKALIYSRENFKHRFIVMFEAAAWSDSDFALYIMRSLLSEGRIAYDTVVDSPDGPVGKRIEKDGPTGLLTTTTAVAIHAENETRLLSLNSDESREQTARVMEATAMAETTSPPDLTRWHRLQEWLERGDAKVSVPFARALARLIPPLAVRLRRDFNALLSLIKSHALVHQVSRERNEFGEIVATIDDDYAAVREIVADLLGENVKAAVAPIVRETVDAVRSILGEGKATATVDDVARTLNVEISNASRRVKRARADGYLRNLETKKGQPFKLVIGETIPGDVAILPTVAQLRAAANCTQTPQPACDADSKPQLRSCAEGQQVPRPDDYELTDDELGRMADEAADREAG